MQINKVMINTADRQETLIKEPGLEFSLKIKQGEYEEGGKMACLLPLRHTQQSRKGLEWEKACGAREGEGSGSLGRVAGPGVQSSAIKLGK